MMHGQRNIKFIRQLRMNTQRRHFNEVSEGCALNYS
jgi:hypothetical protein